MNKKIKTPLIVLLTLMAVCVISMVVLSSCSIEQATTLYIYNWGEYMADGSEGSLDVNELFEEYYFEKYGKRIKVNYSTFSSNEDMYAKISSGAVAYDVIIPSDYMIERLINEKLIQPIYPERDIEYFKHIDDEFKGLSYDPEDLYSVPYAYGMIGIIYNTEMVEKDDPDIGSWKLMWSEKYKGDILQFNNSRDAFGTAFYAIGRGNDVNTENREIWEEALQKLFDQKPIVQGYVMDEIFNKMEGSSAAVSAYYAGDYLTMFENNQSLEFYYPKEGTNYYVDAMCVPTASKNPEIAKEYINFMLMNDAVIGGEEYNIAVENALMTYYASPNELVYTDEYYFKYMEDRFTDEERADGESGIRPGTMAILYPPSEESDTFNKILEANGFATMEEYLGEELTDDKMSLWQKPEIVSMYRNLNSEQLMLLNVLWERLKIRSEVGEGIYIICGVIVAVGASIAIYFAVRNKRREKYYIAPDKKQDIS